MITAVCDSSRRERRGDRARADRRLADAGAGRRGPSGGGLRRRPGHPGHRPHRGRAGPDGRALADRRLGAGRDRRGRPGGPVRTAARAARCGRRVARLHRPGHRRHLGEGAGARADRRPDLRRRPPDGRQGDVGVPRRGAGPVRRLRLGAVPGERHEHRRLADARRAGHRTGRAGGAGHRRRPRPGGRRGQPRTASAGRGAHRRRGGRSAGHRAGRRVVPGRHPGRRHPAGADRRDVRRKRGGRRPGAGPGVGLARRAAGGGGPAAPACAARSAWPPAPGEEAELPARSDVLLRLGRVGGWITAVDRDGRKVTALRPKRTETDRNSS
jgi:hypothetical protein